MNHDRWKSTKLKFQFIESAIIYTISLYMILYQNLGTVSSDKNIGSFAFYLTVSFVLILTLDFSTLIQSSLTFATPLAVITKQTNSSVRRASIHCNS